MSTYRHKEAFCLMLYRDTAGNEEWIWNSRDGVTPFIVRSRQGLEAQHVEWHRDRRAPLHEPKIGDRVFVDLSPERAHELRREFTDRWWDVEVQGEKMCDRYESKEAAIEELARADLEHGGGGGPDLREVTADWRPEQPMVAKRAKELERRLAELATRPAKQALKQPVKQRMHLRRLDERTVIIVGEDQETEIGRITFPEGGVTLAEMDLFIEHLKREARAKEHGPS